MCIRDRNVREQSHARLHRREPPRGVPVPRRGVREGRHPAQGHRRVCLLYTSDAADERSSVDLGGRRIIKKKNSNNHRMQTHVPNRQT